LLLKGRFGYDATPFEWKDDVAVISQVHADKAEAMHRLIKMGISSAPDMCRPFKDLSVGQQDCAVMARALRHGAAIDEFGSNLGPVGLFKLCKGLRGFVREHGLGNITVATCNPQVALNNPYIYKSPLQPAIRRLLSCSSPLDNLMIQIFN
jgi:ABC-type ATPase with predicted acetyltransferase domain